ncbi:MAG: hypothetical protein ACYDCL_17375 [Myxococcales bacterium]
MSARSALLGSLALLVACPKSKGPDALVEGQACASPGAQGSCAPGLTCEGYDAGSGPSSVCRQSCTDSSDCNQVFTENRCVAGVCSCVPGAIGQDACTADDPATVCHPDYGYCAPGVAADAGCNPGEAPAPYDGVLICRPAGAGGDGGFDAGSSGCGIADSQGTCPWPQFCATASATAAGGCALPQNAGDGGQDIPDPLCDYTGGPTGNDNADQIRTSGGQPFGPPEGPSPGGPILITMAQDLSGLYCGSYLGGAQPSPNDALCSGDGTFCDRNDDVAVFTGYVYDPAASFAVSEGAALDKQFLAVVESGSGVGSGEALATRDPNLATLQIGHVVPGAGNWTASGGAFILWRCFTASAVGTQMGGTLIPAHYAQTSGYPGNTFCSTWSTTGGP